MFSNAVNRKCSCLSISVKAKTGFGKTIVSFTGISDPASNRNNAVLPHPLTPTKIVHSPGCGANLTEICFFPSGNLNKIFSASFVMVSAKNEFQSGSGDPKQSPLLVRICEAAQIPKHLLQNRQILPRGRCDTLARFHLPAVCEGVSGN